MSTENTTQDVQHAPVQVQNDIKIITDSITLNAKDIYSMMSQFGTNPRQYNPQSTMAGEEYYMFKCKGAMINVPPEFQQAFADRKLYSVTITGRPYHRTVADPNVAGGNTTRVEQSWSYDSHMTIEDYKAALNSSAEIAKIEIAQEMKTDQLKAMAKKAKSVQMTADEEKLALKELQDLIA